MSAASPPHPRPLVWVPIAVAATVIVTIVGVLVRDSVAITAAELSFLHDLSGMHVGWLTPLALVINTGFGPVGAVIVATIVAVVVGRFAGGPRAAVRFALLVVVPWLTVDLVKAVVSRPRPDPSVLVEQLVREPVSASYPSGHTAFAAALGMAILWSVIACTRRTGVLAVTIAVVVVLTAVTAWSRMYLGVHHPTDVTASAFLVPLVSTAVFAVYERTVAVRHDRREPGESVA